MLASPRLGYPVNLLLRSIQVSFKQHIQEGFRELWIIVNVLVELKVAVDHVLKQVIYNMIKRETCIFGWIDAHTRLEGGVVRQSLLYFPYAKLVFFIEVGSEMLIEFLNDLR